jgi:hypothetical protein
LGTMPFSTLQTQRLGYIPKPCRYIWAILSLVTCAMATKGFVLVGGCLGIQDGGCVVRPGQYAEGCGLIAALIEWSLQFELTGFMCHQRGGLKGGSL